MLFNFLGFVYWEICGLLVNIENLFNLLGIVFIVVDVLFVGKFEIN